MENPNKDKLNEYKERTIRWQDKSLSQLSFFNNILLTLSVGFLSFSYNEERFHDLSLTPSIISILFVGLSIIIGLMVAVNRLYDFRLTRDINQIRQRALKHSEQLLDESTPHKLNWGKRITLTFQVIFECYPKIMIEQCKELKSMNDQEKQQFLDNFRELRTLTHNLGINTWTKTKLQILFFGLGIFFFVIAEIVN